MTRLKWCTIYRYLRVAWGVLLILGAMPLGYLAIQRSDIGDQLAAFAFALCAFIAVADGLEVLCKVR